MKSQEFLLLGRYTPGALKGISAARTKKAQQLIAKARGRILSIHALLGEYDLALLVALPDVEAAVKVSVALARETGIGFTTCPAVPVQRFDRLMGKR